jgi:hypothetical protein
LAWARNTAVEQAQRMVRRAVRAGPQNQDGA